MKQHITFSPPAGETRCKVQNPDNNMGFRVATQHEDEYYVGASSTYHHIIFVLEGEIEFSYGCYLNRRFTKGELFFIPPGVEIYSKTISPSKALILTFNNKMESACDNCALNNYLRQPNSESHDFRSLSFTPQIQMFVDLVMKYIQAKIQCHFMDELKRKELFAILPHNYTRSELHQFFYPIINNNDFRTKVLNISSKGLNTYEIARLLGMSPRNFSRKFVQEFGEPARYWLLKEKAKNIKLKLLIPGTTIFDIILQYKFTDMSHFSKFCKAQYGCTPAILLEELKERNL